MNPDSEENRLGTAPSRRTVGKMVATIAAATLFSVLLAACSNTSEAADTGGASTVRVALSSFGREQLDPALEGNFQNLNALLPMYDTLLDIGKDGKVSPGLATKWEMTPDQNAWVFHLRGDAVFHGGYGKVTSADVQFSIERFLNEKTNVSEVGNLRAWVSKIETPDPLTVKILTKGPQPLLPYLLAPTENSVGMVFSKKFLTEKGGTDFEKQSAALNEHPIGSGPYEFVSRTRGSKIVYKAVAEHWRSKPSFKNLEFLLVPNPSTQISMLKSGEVDIAQVTVDDAEDAQGAGLKVISVPNAQDVGIMFQRTYTTLGKAKPTSDPRVRQALSLAIDRELILKSIIKGHGHLASTPFNVGETTADLDVDAFKEWASKNNRYDPEEAKRLLAEAGYPNGFNGMKVFAIELVGSFNVPQLAEIISQQWKAIGVNTTIVSLDYASYRPHVVRAPETDGFNTGDAYPLNFPGRFVASSSLHTYYKNEGGTVQLAKDPVLDKLIDKIDTTVDPEKRKSLVTEAYDLIDDQWLALALFKGEALYAANARTAGQVETYPSWPQFGRIFEKRK